MRVLFFLPSLRDYLDRLRLVMELSRRVERVVLLIGAVDAEVEIRDCPNLDVEVVGYRSGLWPWNAWRASRMARHILVQERLNIVHDTYGNLLSLFHGRKRFPQATFVTSLFALSGWRARNVFASMALWQMLSARYLSRILLNRWVEQRICRWCDHVVVQAPGLIDRLLEDVAIPREKVHVLTNNVDVEFWAPAQHPRMGPTKLGADLLFVGNFYAGKGLPVLFEALSILKGRGDQSTLKAVGRWVPHSQREVLEALQDYNVKDRVAFLEPVSRQDLRTLYQNSDLLLYQTRDDGSPRVVLEALACGLPVIASHHPGIDHLDPQGEFIAFTEFGDAARVAQHVLDVQASQGSWIKRGRKGRESVRARFSTGAVADAYAAFYRSILRS